jgi:hypothetical protein
VIEDVARSLVGSDERPSHAIRIEKELLWQQEATILSAVLPDVSTGAEKKMILLTEDALVIYGEEQGNWKLQITKILPGPKQPPRSARGQLLLAEGNMDRVGILLPGRRCEANFADDSPIACADGGSDWPAGRLLSLPACGAQAWWLKSDGTDWMAEDRLFIRSSGAAKGSSTRSRNGRAGRRFSIGAGSNAASACCCGAKFVDGELRGGAALSWRAQIRRVLCFSHRDAVVRRCRRARGASAVRRRSAR